MEWDETNAAYLDNGLHYSIYVRPNCGGWESCLSNGHEILWTCSESISAFDDAKKAAERHCEALGLSKSPWRKSGDEPPEKTPLVIYSKPFDSCAACEYIKNPCDELGVDAASHWVDRSDPDNVIHYECPDYWMPIPPLPEQP